jgi:hypothetical protein
MGLCAVKGCKSCSDKGKNKLFRFPRDLDRRKTWSFQVNRTGGWYPNNEDKLCEVIKVGVLRDSHNRFFNTV